MHSKTIEYKMQRLNHCIILLWVKNIFFRIIQNQIHIYKLLKCIISIKEIFHQLLIKLAIKID